MLLSEALLVVPRVAGRTPRLGGEEMETVVKLRVNVTAGL